MMGADPRLMALPALCKRAEEEAKDLHRVIFGHLAGGERLLAWTEAHLSLLSDLTRPESRDAVARLVAEALGLECGATAPGLHRSPAGGRSHWQIGYFPWSVNIWVVDEAADWNCGQRVIVSGISSVTDPAEALTLIALAVLGGAS